MHWFNPLIWVAFALAIKDMEMSCDEGVIKDQGEDFRIHYAKTLLALTAGRQIVSQGPLAFSGGETKGRIKNIMQYKKPVIWISAVLLAAVIVLGVGFALNPPKGENNILLPDLKESVLLLVRPLW